MRGFKNWVLILYLISIVLVPIGCVALEKQVLNYETCLNDPLCAKQVQEATTATTGVATIVADAFDSPMSIPITGLISLITALLAGVYFGSKKNKPKAP